MDLTREIQHLSDNTEMIIKKVQLFNLENKYRKEEYNQYSKENTFNSKASLDWYKT